MPMYTDRAVAGGGDGGDGACGGGGGGAGGCTRIVKFAVES